MHSLIDIRRRIRSVKNTQQITKAMKMVSAAKLRRAQDRVIASRPYGALLRKVLANVAAAAAGDEKAGQNPLLAQRPEQRVLLVLITGDKGLAGAFNSNLIKGAQRFVAERPGVTVKMELIGRKGRDFFRKRNADIAGEHIGMAAKVVYADLAAIAQKAMDLYCKEEIDAVYLLFNEFKSAVAQKLTVRRVLPVEVPEKAERIDYIFEQRIDVRSDTAVLDVKSASQKPARGQPSGEWRLKGSIYARITGLGIAWHAVTKGKTPAVYTPVNEPGLWIPPTPSFLDIAERRIVTTAERLVSLFDRYGPDEAWPTSAPEHVWACSLCSLRPTCSWWAA